MRRTTMTCDDYTETDLAALQLALDLTIADDPPDHPGRVEQVTHFLNGNGRYEPPRPWLEVAEFCAYHQQMRRLNCYPWQLPPSSIMTAEVADMILKQGPRPAVDGSKRDISNCA